MSKSTKHPVQQVAPSPTRSTPKPSDGPPPRCPSTSSPSSAPPTPDPQVCPVCRGLGYLAQDLPIGHPNFGQYLPCDACGFVARRRIARFDEFSSRRGRALGQFFRNFCLDGPAASATDAYNAALAFASDPSGWLVLHGPKGNGKSHLAAAIANHLIDACRTPTLFLTAPDLLEGLRREIRASMQGWSVEPSSLLKAAQEAPVLILDDLGAQRWTAWTDEQLFLLLDHRYRLEMPTVIVTNEALEALPARLYSRLGDHVLCTVVHNPAPDYRWGHGRVTR